MKKVLVLGGTGFVGRHVCEKLVRAHVAVTVPTRRLLAAKALQTLPLVHVAPVNIHDPAALAALLPGHDAVVNLVAILHGNAAAFERTHVTLVRTLANACVMAGVRRLVHVSALGAAVDAPSLYQRSKAQGEAVLRAASLDLTVLRPSVIFGADDQFLNLFARLQAVFPFMPLAGAGTRFQPVWVEDVASAIVRALAQRDAIGQTYEACGPETLTLADLVRLAGRASGHPRPVLPLPHALGWLQALAMECLPGQPLMSRDNLASMKVDNISQGEWPGINALGVTPAALSAIAPTYLGAHGPQEALAAYRRGARRF
jgi:NADH dehydrogenase